MKFVESIRFAEVLGRFRLEHAVDRDHEVNTNGDAENHLVLADAMFGEWTHVYIGQRALQTVILPWHASEGGAIELVPKTGLTVLQAARKIATMRSEYAQACPICWRKIERVASAPPTAIYLATGAIPSEDYVDLEPQDGLVHLDGLHRMIACELDGLLADDRMIEAYIAGPRARRSPTREGD